MIREGIHLAIIDSNTQLLDYTIETFSKLPKIKSITVFTTNVKCDKHFNITYCYLIKDCKNYSEILHQMFCYFRGRQQYRIFVAYSGEILLGFPLKRHKNLDGAFYKRQVLDSFIWQLREFNLLKKWYFSDNYGLNPNVIPDNRLNINKIKGNYLIISLQKQTFALKPNLPNCFYQLGCYYLVMGKLILAETYFKLKLKDNPDNYLVSRCYLALAIIYKTLVNFNQDYFKLLQKSIKASPKLLESCYFYLKWSLESNDLTIIRQTLTFLKNNKVDLLSDTPPENCLLPIDYHIYQYELIYFYLKALLELFKYSDALQHIKLLLIRDDLPLVIRNELINIKKYLTEKIISLNNTQQLFKSKQKFRQQVYCQIIKQTNKIYVYQSKNSEVNHLFKNFITYNLETKLDYRYYNYLIVINKYQHLYYYSLYQLNETQSNIVLNKTLCYVPGVNQIDINKTFQIANVSFFLLKTNNICHKVKYHPDLYLTYNTVFYHHDDEKIDDITYLFNCLHLLHTGVVLLYDSKRLKLKDYFDFSYLKKYVYDVSGWSVEAITRLLNKCTTLANNRNNEFLKKSLDISKVIFQITNMEPVDISVLNSKNSLVNRLTQPIKNFSEIDQIKDRWIIIVPPKLSLEMSQFLLIIQFIKKNPDTNSIFVVDKISNNLLLNFKLTMSHINFKTTPCDNINNIYFFYANNITPILTNNLIRDFHKFINIYKIN